MLIREGSGGLLTNKHALIDVEILGVLEAFRRAFFDMNNVLGGEVLGNACISDRMIKDVARVGKSSCNRDCELDFGHVDIVPFVEPDAQILFGFVVLMSVPQRYRIPDPDE